MQNQRQGGAFLRRGRAGGDGFPFTDPNSLERYFNQQQMPNVSKEFVHPGKEPRELVMRSIFKNEQEANAFVLYYAKCIEFALKDEEEILLSWLASRPAINGIARRELLMAVTNIIAPSLYPNISVFSKRGFGSKKKDDEEETGQ